jgi:CrcB protein
MNPTVRNIAAVFVGGLAGSFARLGLTAASAALVGTNQQPVTLIINVLGSFLLGVVVGYRSSSMPDWAFNAAGIGFLGSFTTLSAVSIDVATSAITEPAFGLSVSVAYAIANIAFGVFAAVVGLRMGKRRLGAPA